MLTLESAMTLSALFTISSPHLISIRLTQARSFNQAVVKQALYQRENHYFSALNAEKVRRILTRFRFLPTG
jgi:hypothetical protein